MTAPTKLATPKTLSILELTEIAYRLTEACTIAAYENRMLPMSEDTMPALIDQVQEIMADLAKWERVAVYQEGEPQ